jgi:hypothetical protein
MRPVLAPVATAPPVFRRAPLRLCCLKAAPLTAAASIACSLDCNLNVSA